MRSRLIGTASAPIINNEEEEGGIVAFDKTPTEWTTGHIALRDDCVKHFDVAFKAKEVEWLKYPDRHRA